MIMKQLLRRSAVMVAVMTVLAGSVVADDVTDTIENALDAYKHGEYSTAAEDLSYAMELIKQKKGESLKDYFPKPLSGWKAEDATSQTAGSGMMGGGTVVNRRYKKGNSEIAINMVTDSPMMQGFAMMMGNPMFATSDGGKMIRIKRQKAMLKYDKRDQSGEISMMVANRIMVTIAGEGISEDELMAYAKAIDVRKLSNMQ